MPDIDNIILLAHGSGGTHSRNLIRDVFVRHFSNTALDAMGDSAVVEIESGRIAFTTDSYVVKPLKFPGGDIGKLAVCGTINDLAVAGARPLYLTASFIIEEGIPISLVEEIVASMAKVAQATGVKIVAGDTKVVEKGGCDKIFITTAGVGKMLAPKPMSPSRIEAGDAILINGPIADHGMAIMAAREGLSIKTKIESDCAPLDSITAKLLETVPDTKFMRDVTRGGLATVLNEMADGQTFGIEIDEDKIPVREGTKAVCEILGIDPLYVANEGKFVAVVPQKSADAALASLKAHTIGKESQIIGRATPSDAGRVSMITSIGTKRLVAMMSGEQLPRIC